MYFVSQKPLDVVPTVLPLIDTHTHFDVPDFDRDRAEQSRLAYDVGVRHVVLIGFLAQRFDAMLACQNQLQQLAKTERVPQAHLAFGLHPAYICQHAPDDIDILAAYLDKHGSIAIGEIGLDTFTAELKAPENYAKQQQLFDAQLNLATQHRLPVLLHIRRAHADAIAMLKAAKFVYGGIAHSFSGGIQEAKALVDLGFKIGVTGQVTNPNAKKLRRALVELVTAVGLDSLVIETDCPDFTPLPCHATHGRRNVPANLLFVLAELATLLNVEQDVLAKHLWHNSSVALQQDFGAFARV